MTKPAKKKGTGVEPRSEQHDAALDDYEKGLRLLQQKDYQKAIPRFEAILAQTSGEGALCDRARVYLRIASGESAAKRPLRQTRTPAESYEVGVFLLNEGEPKEALRHLERAAEHAPDNAGVQVALASARLQSGDVDGSLVAVARAIELDGSSRYKVRNMTDFDDLEDSPEFGAMVADE